MVALPALADPFSQPFMVHALLAAALIALCAGPIGWFVVARREAFAAHTLSVMAFPGGAVAAALGLPLAAGYYLLCLVAGAVLSALRGRLGRLRWLQESALVGTVQAVALAVGFLVLALYGGVLEDLEALLFGSPFGVSGGDLALLVGLAVVVLGFLAAFGRPLLLTTIEPKLATAAGVPAGALEGAFIALLGLVVAATAQVSGALLVFSLLVAPAAAAQRLTASLPRSFGLAVLLGFAIGSFALLLSYWTNLPPGFLLSTVALAAYLLANGAALLQGSFGKEVAGVRP